MLKYSTLSKHRDQLLSESLAWHTMQGALTTSNVKPYTAGYEQGFRDALATLKLHAELKVDYNH